jgi:hypothetical protein
MEGTPEEAWKTSKEAVFRKWGVLKITIFIFRLEKF